MASPCSVKEAYSMRPVKIPWTSSPVKLPNPSRFQSLLSILLLTVIAGTAFQTSLEELCTTIVWRWMMENIPDISVGKFLVLGLLCFHYILEHIL